LQVRGVAWGGAGGIDQVLARVDDGPWRPAALGPRRGAYARIVWTLETTLEPGTHELACCAIDREGQAQPERPPVNVDGYANNSVHRVRVAVGAVSSVES
jgi:hypothetical protein